MEVKDLEDEMEGLNKRVEKIEEEMAEVNHLILKRKISLRSQSLPSKNTKNNKKMLEITENLIR